MLCKKLFQYNNFRIGDKIVIDEKSSVTTCTNSFSSAKSSVEKKISVHNKRKKHYKCWKCTMSFSELSKLVLHLKVHPEDKPFSCSICTLSFAQPHYLKRHMGCHDTKKAFSCSECKKSFTTSSGLIEHMIVHTREKPMRCQECDKSFFTKYHLNRQVYKSTLPI